MRLEAILVKESNARGESNWRNLLDHKLLPRTSIGVMVMFFQRELPAVGETPHLPDHRMERYQRLVILWSFPNGRRWIARRNHADNGGAFYFNLKNFGFFRRPFPLRVGWC